MHIIDPRDRKASFLDTILNEQNTWHRATELTNQDKQAELDCVLKSATFARSEQLRSFLLYVCRMEMEGRSGELNEYLVGVEALGRLPSYSPTDDSSVRSRAWELRQKLLKLYGSERPDSPVRIDLPRGGYAPQYLIRGHDLDNKMLLAPQTASVPEMQVLLPASTPYGRRPLLISILSGLAVVAIAVGVSRFWKPSPANGIDPVIRQAWGSLLEPDSPNMLVMANGLYLLVRPDAPSGIPSKHLYAVPPELYSEYQQRRPLADGGKLIMFTSENVVQMGYINSLVAVSGVLQRARQPFNVVPERVVTPSAIRNRNVILFGAPQDSIAVTEVLTNGVYHFGYDPVKDIVIQKGTTALKDSPYFRSRSDGHDVSVTYGLITVTPSLGAERERKTTVVFSGITSVGAQGAAEFFVSSQYMKDLRDRFRKAGAADFPPAYQVVVRCRASDTLLISFEYADSAILPQTKS